MKKNKFWNGILLIMGLALVGVAGYKLWGIYQSYHTSDALYTSYKDEFTKAASTNDKMEIPWNQLLEVDLAAAREQNEDIIGWLYFENEDISYPILQSTSDDFYLFHSVDKEASNSGSIFLEALNRSDFSDMHSIIYGHNMKDLSMFGKLKYYQKEDYYADHMYFQVITENCKRRYVIFAYEDVPEDSEIYDVSFQANENYEAFLKKIIRASFHDTGIVPSMEDSIITLSTCSAEERRFVVHGMLIETD